MRRGVVGGLSRASVIDNVVPPAGTLEVATQRALLVAGASYSAVADTTWRDWPRFLFLRGEQGVWFDPSDLSTMFQDELGSVPVTGVEQPVRRILDKSGNGHHATASADARRPVLSARVNLLDGTAALATQSVTVVAASHTLSFTGDGTVTLSGASTAGPLVGTGATDRVSLVFTPTAGSLTLTVSGTVTDADLRVTNDGVGLPAYQRVTTSTDYDTAGFPLYLRFDGTDDCLVTGIVNLSATDKVTVCAGARKLSDGSRGQVVESGLGAGSEPVVNVEVGFPAFAPATNLALTALAASSPVRGFSLRVTSGVTAPATRILTSLLTIPNQRQSAFRLNQVSQGTYVLNGQDLFTERLPDRQIFIGARNNASDRFNGRLYQLVVRGALTDTPVLEQLERFVNAKTRAF
jgi:hypothetical protein